MIPFLADGPDWHLWSWTGVWFSFFSAVDGWIGSALPELHGFNQNQKNWQTNLTKNCQAQWRVAVARSPLVYKTNACEFDGATHKEVYVCYGSVLWVILLEKKRFRSFESYFSLGKFNSVNHTKKTILWVI